MSEINVKQVKLPSYFVQLQLSALKQTVHEHMENGDRVQFESAEVERVDGAAVQFLLAVHQLQSANDSSEPLMLDHNDVLVKACCDMGVGDLIDAQTTQSN